MKILHADDHQIFRDSLKLLFDFEEDIEVIGEASNGTQVMEALKTLQPDIILMDVSMNGMGGVETSRLVKQKYPQIKILILSMNSEREHILGALEAGVDGYLLKSAGKNEVLRAIRTVFEGSSYYSKVVTDEIVNQLNQLHQPKKIKTGEALSAREIEILSLIAKQFSSTEIAKQLFISVRTVDAHRRNMLEKLGLKNAAGLVKYAIEHGLI
ncbi:MAG: response regulator transcription factor [Saprospiraceae bacterium]|nr:response regulator transcription factor [Saprospiraceae bacterium]